MLQQSLRRAMPPRRQSTRRRWCSAQDLQLHILSARLLSSPLKGQPRRGWFQRWTGQGQTSWRTGWNLGRLRWFRWLVMLHPFAYSMLMFCFLHEHNYVIVFQIRGPLNSIRLLLRLLLSRAIHTQEMMFSTRFDFFSMSILYQSFHLFDIQCTFIRRCYYA